MAVAEHYPPANIDHEYGQSFSSRIFLEAASLLSLDLTYVHPIYTRGEGVSRGNGQPIITLPGNGRSDHDISISLFDHDLARLRDWAGRMGYYPHASDSTSGTLLENEEKFVERLRILKERTGQRVAIVAPDVGAEFALGVAVRSNPEDIGAIISLGSDLSRVDSIPSGIKLISIYGKSNGVTDYRRSIHEEAVNVEIEGLTHNRLFNPRTYKAIGEALADTWGHGSGDDKKPEEIQEEPKGKILQFDTRRRRVA